jgi:predicted dehydrogenase
LGGKIAERKTVSNADGYSRMLDAFSDWVEGRGTFRATGADGLHNQQVLDAAYASWRSSERQALPSS